MKKGIKKINRHILLERLTRTGMAIVAIFQLPLISSFLFEKYKTAYDKIQEKDWLEHQEKHVEKTHPIYKSLDTIKKKTGLKENILVFENISGNACDIHKHKNSYYITILRPYTDNFTHEDWESIVAHELSHALNNDHLGYKEEAIGAGISIEVHTWAKQIEAVASKLLSFPPVTFAFPAFAPETTFAALSTCFCAMRYARPIFDKLSLFANRQRELAADEIALQLVDKPETYRNTIMTLDGIAEVENKGLYIPEFESRPKDFASYVEETKQNSDAEGFHTFFKNLPNDRTLLFMFRKAASPEKIEDFTHPTLETRLKNIDHAISALFGKATLAHCRSVAPCEKDILMKCYAARGANDVINETIMNETILTKFDSP